MKALFTSIMFMSAAGASSQSLIDSLIAHFPMNGSPNDTVSGLVPLVTSGEPTFCADRFGNPEAAACFDGASFWSYGDVLDMDTSAYAITAWIRADTVLPPFDLGPGPWGAEWLVYGGVPVGKGGTVYATPPGSGYSIHLRQLASGAYMVHDFTGDSNGLGTVASGPFTTNSWFSLAVTRCGTEHSIYVNGSLVSEISTQYPRNVNTNIHFAFGAGVRDPTSQPNTDFLDGALDDVRIYKGRCLTDAEIQSLADLSVTVSDSAPGQLQLRLSPNPTTQTLRIDLATPLQVAEPVIALNALGQRVAFRAGALTMVNDAIKSFSVDVSELPNGAYFVVVPTVRGKLHGRFIKE
jgi:hypothetical protein